jgi:hypothetical protein
VNYAPVVGPNANIDLSVTFPTAGTVNRDFVLQITDASGNVIAGTSPFTITVTVPVGSQAQPPAVPPTCAVGRNVAQLIDNNQRTAIATIIQTGGGQATSATINGNPVALGQNVPINFISVDYHYEVHGLITGPGGTTQCDMTFDVPKCFHNLIAFDTATVTTELSFVGPVNYVQIQGVSQTVPQSAPWKVSYRHNVSGNNAHWELGSSGYVRSSFGDSYTCQATNATINFAWNSRVPVYGGYDSHGWNLYTRDANELNNAHYNVGGTPVVFYSSSDPVNAGGTMLYRTSYLHSGMGYVFDFDTQAATNANLAAGWNLDGQAWWGVLPPYPGTRALIKWIEPSYGNRIYTPDPNYAPAGFIRIGVVGYVY